MSDIGNLVGELRLQGSRLSHRAADAIESLAAHDAEVAAKALEDTADEVDARWDDTGLGAVGASWLRARAAEYRKAVQSE